MKVLQSVTPTAEQLPIIRRNDPGVTLIRGAAGSGKTTTALLRIKFLAAAWKARHQRLGITRPVKMLVLTYNTTLRGYIKELTDQQVSTDQSINVEVKTFGKWAKDLLPGSSIAGYSRMHILASLAAPFPNERFIIDEAEYAMGKFLPEAITDYLDAERVGRGRAPRCDRLLRNDIINRVIAPYTEWKKSNGVVDFNDLATELAKVRHGCLYDVVIIDEAQDFSANEVRAVLNHLETDHSITFVLDGAQRIYPKNFTWREVGIRVNPSQNFKLGKNYRNTKEIAAFITPLLLGVEIGDDDGALPDFESCDKTGRKPVTIVGKYAEQLDWAIAYIRREIDLSTDSVAFLKPMGGAYFQALSNRLGMERLNYIELTRKSDWPAGTENIAICTMHSAKGLEFDHVIVLGLNEKVTPHGHEPGDVQLDVLRRLLAMALGRARSSIVIGYKESEASTLIRYFQPGTYEKIIL